jgi:hypothetical protein
MQRGEYNGLSFGESRGLNIFATSAAGDEPYPDVARAKLRLCRRERDWQRSSSGSEPRGRDGERGATRAGRAWPGGVTRGDY